MGATPAVVWVTGGASGIGLATASLLAAVGHTVVASARTVAGLESNGADTHPAGTIVPLVCDVCSEDSVSAAYDAIIARFGRVDLLVNSAGVTVFKSFLETSVGEFDRILATNLRGAFLCTRAVLPAMLERGSGMIVMVNSVAARQVFPDSAVYAASKAGLKMMTDCLRHEVRKSGIRVLTLMPGATNTPIWPERARERHGARMMDPDDVAAAILQAWQAPARMMMEEITLQPIGGPL